MAEFKFTNKFLTDHTKVERQHKRLLQLVAEFFSQVGTGTARNNAIKKLNELVNYARQHFSSEETHELLANGSLSNSTWRTQNQGRKSSKTGHRGKLVPSTNLPHLLRDWLTEHILKYDIANIKQVQFYKNVI